MSSFSKNGDTSIFGKLFMLLPFVICCSFFHPSLFGHDLHYVGASLSLFIFFLFSFNSTFTVSRFDYYFLAFIAYSFLSIFYSINQGMAIQFVISLILIFLFYKYSQKIILSFHSKWLFYAVFMCLIISEVNFLLVATNQNFTGTLIAVYSIYLLLNKNNNYPFKLTIRTICWLSLFGLIFFTKSVGSIIVVGVFLTSHLFNLKNKKYFKLSNLVGLTAAVLILLVISSKFTTYSFVRFSLWKDSLLMLLDHFPFGVGANNWWIGIKEYQESQFLNPHNVVIKVMSELGFMGLLFLFLIFIKPWVQFLKLKGKGAFSNPFFVAISIVLIFSNIYLVIFHQFVKYSSINMILLFFYAQLNQDGIKKYSTGLIKKWMLSLLAFITTAFFVGDYCYRYNFRISNKEYLATVEDSKLLSCFYFKYVSRRNSYTYNKATKYERKGNFNLARKNYIIARDLDPFNFKIRMEISDFYSKSEKFQNAIEELEQVDFAHPHLQDVKEFRIQRIRIQNGEKVSLLKVKDHMKQVFLTLNKSKKAKRKINSIQNSSIEALNVFKARASKSSSSRQRLVAYLFEDFIEIRKVLK